MFRKTPLIVFYATILFLIGCNQEASKYSKDTIHEILHIVHTGQSLGAGSQSLPLVSDSITNPRNLKFKIGTHTWANTYYPDKPELRKDSLFQLTPLSSQRRVVEGETIANGVCDHITNTAKLNKQTKLLFSYAGEGGRYLRELDKQHDDAKDPRAKGRQSKGGYYKTSIDDIKRAKEFAKNYSVLAVTWMQGEANSDRKVNRWSKPLSREELLNVYKNDLIQIKRDYQTDISTILGKKVKTPFFTYQTMGTMSGTAQLTACDEEPEMFMVAPTYMMPSAENGFYEYKNKGYHGNFIHLAADSQRWLGEQFGKVIRKVVFEKEKW
ncbi:MAG TPA: hypothetical protein EYG92_08250 [Lutibacter sp.]|nr:hypothetical protein [Lutibacter sp.]